MMSLEWNTKVISLLDYQLPALSKPFPTFVCDRGSSDDDLVGKGQRSSQSTPRMSRSLVRDPNPDGRRSFGSLGSMENYRVQVWCYFE